MNKERILEELKIRIEDEKKGRDIYENIIEKYGDMHFIEKVIQIRNSETVHIERTRKLIELLESSIDK